jgi:hypothetical protein
MGMSKTRKMNIAGLAVLLLSGTLVSFYPFYAATREMRAFCAALPTGASYAQVQARAAEAGYAITPLADGRATIEDPPSYGRRACEVAFGPQGLVASR